MPVPRLPRDLDGFRIAHITYLKTLGPGEGTDAFGNFLPDLTRRPALCGTLDRADQVLNE